MTWKQKVQTFGKPKTKTTYQCEVKHFGTGKVVQENLIWRNGEWRIASDGAELDEWNWDVIAWKDINATESNSGS